MIYIYREFRKTSETSPVVNLHNMNFLFKQNLRKISITQTKYIPFGITESLEFVGH